MAETIGTAVVKVIADGDGFAADAERQIRAHGKDFERAGEETSKKFHTGAKKNDKKETDGRMARIRKRLDSWGDRFEKSGQRIGKAFGRGSRNDFLNAFGGFVSLGPRLLGLLVELAKKFTNLGKGVENAGEDVDSFKDILLNVAKEGLPGLIAAAAIAVGSIASVAAMMGPLGSAIVLASGLVLALAGSLGFALVGALGAVAGALVPFAAAIGVAAIAIGGLNKKSQAFKDLKKQWKDLQQETAKRLFGKDMGGLKVISGLLKTVKPLIDGVATAVGGLLKEFGKATQSKGFKDLIKSIGDALPGMVTTLGHIAGNLGTFLGEAFVAAEPMIKEFLGWLEKVTGAMADFGKPGKGGKSGLSKFFEEAWSSAKKVFRVVEDIGKIIALLFDAGKDTGDSVFEKLAGWLEGALTKLQEMKDDGTLQQMFDDAETFAGKIGDIIIAVGNLIDALDTPGNRGILFTLLDVITGIIDGVTWVVTKVDEARTAIINFALGVGGFFSGLGPKVKEVETFFQELPGKIAGFFTGLGTKIVTAAGDLVSAFGTWVLGVVTSIPGFINQILTAWAGLDDKIATSMGDMVGRFGTWLAGLPAQAITVAGQIIVGFINLAGRMITAAGSLIGAFLQWAVDLPGKSVQLAVNIAVGFANLAIRIFQGAGNLASQFGVWISGVPGKLKALAKSLPGFFSGLASKIVAAAGSLASRFASWVASLPGKARAIANQAAAAFAGLAGKIIARAGSVAARFASWVASLPGKARSIANQIASAFSGLASKAIAKAGSIVAAVGRWASGVASRAAGVANDIVNAFRGLASRIIDAIGTIIPKIQMPHITIPHITPIVDKPGASGFVTAGPQTRLIGEAGPEAVVPLNRPLNQVDPAVRMLSAFAQGKLKFPNVIGGGGKTIDVGGITINTPAEDPRAVASEVVAHMAAAAYI